MRSIAFFIFALIVSVLVLSFDAYAEEPAAAVVSADGFSSAYLLNDGDERTYSSADRGSVTLSCGDGIASLYVVFNRLPEVWTLTAADGSSVACGENTFLHEFVDVKQLLGGTYDQLTLSFSAYTSIAEIYAFTTDDVPDWVQKWLPPCEEADLLLFSSHSDDEQLFFAGVLPYYAIERGLTVQVAYIINHFDTYARPHEQLDGLWTVGVRHYPVMTDFPDLYSESEEQALSAFAAYGVEYEDFISYMTDTIRRFKPLVVVSHDLKGEYGHGTHILCAKALTQALEYCNDSSFAPESAEQYGTWLPEKTYLHLYEENQITMDWDTPYESMGGKTPFEMTRLGFECHTSQHWTWFYNWIYGWSVPVSCAADIRSYSPCKYGLYQTSVGIDSVGGDFFENVTTYPERYAAEQAAREEAERLAAEQAAKEEAERLAAEKAAEEERIAAEQAAKQTTSVISSQEQTAVIPAAEAEAKPVAAIAAVCGAIGVLLAVSLMIYLKAKNKSSRK